MKITACVVAYEPFRSNEREVWFSQMLYSAKSFDEVIICYQSKKETPEWLSNFGRVVVPDHHLCAEEAFQFAASFATNPWITVGCDDDYYCPDNVKLLKNHDPQPGVIYFPHYAIYPEDEKIGVIWPMGALQGQGFTLDQLAENNFISTASLIHKDVLEKTGGWRYRDDEAGDWSLWIRALKLGTMFSYFPLPLYYQRYIKNSSFQQQVNRVGEERINQRAKELANGQD